MWIAECRMRNSEIHIPYPAWISSTDFTDLTDSVPDSICAIGVIGGFVFHIPHSELP